MPYPSIASRRLLIEHSYRLVSDRATIIAHLAAYWKSRGFNLSEDTDGSLCGTRGSYIANFTSFDSTKLISSISVQCLDNGEVTTMMVVDLSGQILTSWNQLDLALEQVLCQRGFTGLPEPTALRKYRQSHALANVMWVLTLGLITNVMPESWRTLLEDVNPSTTEPVLRLVEPGEH
jgi:hypothetical protein